MVVTGWPPHSSLDWGEVDSLNAGCADAYRKESSCAGHRARWCRRAMAEGENCKRSYNLETMERR
jgi:hypothetical protein